MSESFATPWTVADQAPLSMRFPRQELLVCAVLSCFSHVWLCVALWSIIHQAPLSMGFSDKNTVVNCYALLQGTFLTQGLKMPSLMLPTFIGGFFTTIGNLQEIFPTQGSNLHLLHCRWILYQLLLQKLICILAPSFHLQWSLSELSERLSTRLQFLESSLKRLRS